MEEKKKTSRNNSAKDTDYVSVSDIESSKADSGQHLSEYGIFGFLADSPIFNIEVPQPYREETLTKEIVRSEDNRSDKKPAAPERKTNALYDTIYLFGMSIIRFARSVSGKFRQLFRRPFHAISVFAGIFMVLCDNILLRSLKNSTEDFRRIKADFKKARHGEKGSLKGSFSQSLKNLPTYLRASYKRHTLFYKSVVNTVVPLISLIILIATVNSWTASTYALEVIIDNNGEERSLGYISDESVFIEARTIVKDRIDSGTSEESLIANPTYKITRVKLNELSDADAISDRLIERSDSKLSSACGVYIDGQFVCAVKNETDARSVFNSILAEAEKEYKIDKTDENSFADFVENVEFIQGLYPDNEERMWEASKLRYVLENEKKSEAIYYTVKSGDTPSGVAARFDIKQSELKALNPNVDFENFNIGTKLTISSEVSFVRVKIIKIVEKNVSTAYKTETVESAKLFRGDKRVIRKGVKGTDKVTYLVTYIDGVQTDSEEIDRITLIEPVAEKIQVGTKRPSVHGSGSSGGKYEVVSKGRFVWPVSGLYTVTSHYGNRRSGFHTGLDISGGGASGKLVLAAESGTVELVKRSNRSYGNQVVINHGNGVKTRYAHMLDGSISVSVGQKVSRGQAIGRVGNTGNSTGPHLHFEVIVNGNCVNPYPYIK